MPCASTAVVPAMWFSAKAIVCEAEGDPATMSSVAVSSVTTRPWTSAATADTGSVVAPATNRENSGYTR